MALRHIVSRFDNGIVAPACNDSVARFLAPEVLEFRPGADMEKVVQSARAAGCVQVEAAVGAGKSVRLPSLLAKAAGVLVVHCVPLQHAAWALSEYVATVSTVPVKFVSGVSDKLPNTGLVFMSNMDFFLRLVSWRSGFSVPPEKMVLFLDESHESDAASAVLREVARTQPYIESVVFASATTGPVNERPREAAGTVREVQYPEEAVSDWDLSDPRKPWGADSFDGDTLIFVERAKDAERLLTGYREYGLVAYRLHSKMPLAEYQLVIRQMSMRNRGMCVLLADYGFRSSVTFPTLTRVIDPCVVSYYEATPDGLTVRRERRAYQFEHVQAAGRAFRTPGSGGYVFRPAIKLEMAICDLEGVEVDAAAVMFRMLGYQTPKRYADVSGLAKGKVPKDLYGALASPLAITTYAGEWVEWGAFIKGMAVKPRVGYVGSPVVIPPRPRTPDGMTMSDLIAARSSPSKSFGLGLSVSSSEPVSPVSEIVKVEEIEKPDLSELLDLTRLEIEGRGETGFVRGEYVYYPGVELVEHTERHFAEGFSSVERVAQTLNLDVAVTHWEGERRMAATRLAVDAYNNSLAQVRACAAVVEAFGGTMGKISEFVDVSVVRQWLVGLQETMVVNQVTVDSASHVLAMLQERGYSVLHENLREMELAGAYLSNLSRVAQLREDTSVSKYVEKWKAQPLPSVDMAAMRTITHHETQGRMTRKMLTDHAGTGEPEVNRNRVLAWQKPNLPQVQQGATMAQRFAKAMTVMRSG